MNFYNIIILYILFGWGFLHNFPSGKNQEVSLVKKKVFVDVELIFKSYTANILLDSPVGNGNLLTSGDYENDGFNDLTPRP